MCRVRILALAPSVVRRATVFVAVGMWVMNSIGPAIAQETLWDSRFGTEGFDAIYSIDDHAGNVFGAGEVDGALAGQKSAGSSDVVVRSYSASGEVRWTDQFGTDGDDLAEGIAVATDGVYAAGSVEGSLHQQRYLGDGDAFVRKYDLDGDVLWTRQFGTENFEHAAGAAADVQGVFAVGQVLGSLPGQSPSRSFNGFVRHYDAAGNEQWTRQISTTGAVMLNEADIAPGGVVVVGRAAGPLPGKTHAGGRDVIVRKYDVAGNELWTRQFGTPGNDIAWGVDVTSDAIYISGDVAGALPGQSYSGGPLDAFVRKYDLDGNEIWTRQFGTAGFDRAIRVAAEGSLVIVVGRVGGAFPGQTFAGGATDPFVRRYSSDGDEVWTLQFGSTLEPEAATGVAVGDSQELFVCGGVGTFESSKSRGSIDAFVMRVGT